MSSRKRANELISLKLSQVRSRPAPVKTRTQGITKRLSPGTKKEIAIKRQEARLITVRIVLNILALKESASFLKSLTSCITSRREQIPCATTKVFLKRETAIATLGKSVA